MINDFPYKSILIACSVNTARSPMTEGYLRRFFDEYNLNVEVKSGGIASNARDGMLISMDAKLAMEEEGIILSETSTSVDLKKKEHEHLVNNADLIITLTELHKQEILKLKEAKNNKKTVLTLREFGGGKGDIEDPSMKGIGGFRKVRDEIKECLINGLKKWMENND